MEEKHIRQKAERGYIQTAIAREESDGFALEFKEDNGQRHQLTLQRGNIRIFATLGAAANTVRKIGLKNFFVIFKP